MPEGTSEFILDGANNQTVTSSTNSFYDLTIANTSTNPGVRFADNLTVSNLFQCVTPGATLTFTAGTTGTVNHISFNGQAAGTRITLQSSSSGAAWCFKVGGTQSVRYVRTSDSDASSGKTILAWDGTSQNMGRNINWFFASPGTVFSVR